MGCDIHMAVEFRSGSSAWRFLEQSDQSRSYILFAILAGVRNRYEIEPVTSPRGLPPHIAPETRMIVATGTHSHSWLDFEELLSYQPDSSMGDRAIHELIQHIWRDFLEDCTAWIAAASALAPVTPRDMRLVFSFDN